MSETQTNATGTPRRRASAAYVAMVAVAMVVGAGIFKSPALAADSAGSAFWLFAAWIAGGFITLIGALCYAELAAAFPNAGGDYHFLKLAYGKRIAFLFAWARFAVINTGAVALLGFVLGDYLQSAYPLGANGNALYAFACVAILTAFNLRGAVKGQDEAEYGLTSLEVIGVLIVAGAGVWLCATGVPAAEPFGGAITAPPAGFGQALVFVLLAYGGWSEIATLSAEVKDEKRGMLRALVAATALISVLYVLVNWAFWYGLGVAGLAASEAPAADLMAKAFGAWAGPATAIAIACAVITSVNATIVVGARTTFACAADWPALQRIGRWDEARAIPRAAIIAQGVVSLALVGLGAAFDGFATLVDYTAPVFWLFLTLSGVGVLILRRREPEAARPFRVPLYPALPLAFAATSAAMFASSLGYVSSEGGQGAFVGVAVLASGGLALMAVARLGKKAG